MSNLYEINYNPDVLSCIANLSNDEVFTPPDVANKMLDMLPQELFSDPNTKFLDPACKSGVFLREITKRLIKGLEDKIPNLQERVNHILQNQVYGIAITELTGLLSRRTLYCSKYANSLFSQADFKTVDGNIRFKNTNHRFKNGKCLYCGASESEYGTEKRKDLESHAYEIIHTIKPEEIFKMKFDVIIGNPPYQMSDGGNGSSAKPIYNKFIERAKKLKPRYITMIIPARWYAGGKGLDNFRNTMLNDTHIKNIIDYPNPKDCFPGINISGGVCYFLWSKEYSGNCYFTNVIGNIRITKERKLNEFEYFVRYNSSVSIIHKVMSKNEEMLCTIITSRKPFGLDSYVRGNSKKQPYDVKIVSSAGIGYMKKDKIEQGVELIDKYKVIIGKALSGHIGETDGNGQVKVLAKVELLKPNEVCTESYLCVGKYENSLYASNLEKFLKTKFCRFLLLQALSSMNITKDKFCFVPIQDFTDKSDIDWSMPVEKIDQQLYAKYGLNEEEINFIESMIKPME